MLRTPALVPVMAALSAVLVACSDASGPGEVPRPGRPNYLYASDFAGATLGEKVAAAIDALPAGGGVVDAAELTGEQRIDRTVAVGAADEDVEVRLGSATITASAVAFHLTGGARLVGDGRTVIRQADGANLAALVSGSALESCEIAELTIDGNRSGNTGAGSAIDLTGARRCRLHQLVVRNTVGRLHPAIRFSGEGNEDNTIEHNTVEDIGTLEDYADAIYVSGPGNKVLFNRIRRATDFGIVGEFCSGCVIEGNDIVDVPAGIAVGSGIAGRIAQANVIDGNIISGGFTTTWGIITIYRTQGLPPAATVVKGNVIRDVEQGHGIFVNGAEEVSLDGNVLSGIGETYDNYGIFVRDSRSVVVKGGSIARTGSFGIGIGNSANVLVDGVLITDAARSGNEASGVGLDVLNGSSTSVSLVRLHIFDSARDRAAKRMRVCIDFSQGGSTTGVLLNSNLFDDGVSPVGCRDGVVNTAGAFRVTKDW